MTLFRKKTIKGDPHAEYQTTIRFLDDSEPTILTFKKDTLGQVLFDQVCEKLNLLEKDYFGLRYVDSEKQRHWLDPLKSVYRQLKGVNPLVLCFRVKFYPAEPSKLHEEITRYYLFLQLRRDLHHGRLLCSQSDANLLAAYILQSEIGDYDPEEHPVGYVSEFKMLPKQNARTEEQIMELHKTLAGQNPAEAEANFLKKACTLDTYGVDPHQVKDQKSQNLYLGVTHQGIMTFLGNRRTQLYKWNQIKKIAFEGKMFIVHVNVTEDEDATNNKKEHIIVLKKQKKQQPIGYKCATVGACKYLWRCAVEQQLFFTLNDSSHTPKVRSGGSFFSRGSKFRFSGRCQNEAYLASDDIKRNEPTFTRSSSLPNFARKSDSKNSIRPSSLMKEMVKEDKAKKKYNESPVDVQDLEKKAEVKTLQRGPVLAAPLAAEESIALENAGSAQASAPNGPSLTPEIKINGTVVTGVSSLDDSILPYEPEQTILEDPPVEKHVSSYSGEETPDEERTKMSLDEQLNHLEEELKKMETQTKSNHFVEQEVTAEEVCSNNVQANHVDHGENHAKEKVVSPSVSSGVSCCKVFMFTFFFLFLTLAVVLVVILNSDLEHPWLDELRQQVKYIDPMRDYVTHTIEQLFQS